MKRIAYSFLLVALMSCGNNLPTAENVIRIEVQNTAPTEYVLLSLRGQSLVVSKYVTEARPVYSLIASAQIIPLDKVDRIYYDHQASIGSTGLPGIGGCFLGTAAGCGTGLSLGKGFSTVVAGGFIGGFLGFALGIIIGTKISTSEKIFFPERKDDVDEIRKLVFFPDGEPPELQKIK